MKPLRTAMVASFGCVAFALGVPEDTSRLVKGEIVGSASAQYYGTARRVSRRTARRTVRRRTGYYGAPPPRYAYPPLPPGARYVGGLPGGCVAATYGGYSAYRCGGVYYRPYYQGTQVVYVVVR